MRSGLGNNGQIQVDVIGCVGMLVWDVVCRGSYNDRACIE